MSDLNNAHPNSTTQEMSAPKTVDPISTQGKEMSVPKTVDPTSTQGKEQTVHGSAQETNEPTPEKQKEPVGFCQWCLGAFCCCCYAGAGFFSDEIVEALK